MKRWITSFRPISFDPVGNEAAKKNDIAPFVDGSIRREPDFKHPRPGISAICRGRNFAPRLEKDDLVAYWTTKPRGGHRRLVAILQVVMHCKSHEEAAAWYTKEGYELPVNCMVADNPPLPLGFACKPYCDPKSGKADTVEEWDAKYTNRTIMYPVFWVCSVIKCELYNPPVISEELLHAMFVDIPRTRIPINTYSKEQFDWLQGLFR